MTTAGIAVTIYPGQSPFGQRKNCSELPKVVELDLIEDSVWAPLPTRINAAVSSQDDIAIHDRLEDAASSRSARYTVDRIALETMAPFVSCRSNRDPVPNGCDNVGRRATAASVMRDLEDLRPEDSRAESC